MFNRWKSDADINFEELINYLQNDQQSRFLLTQDDLTDNQSIANFIKKKEHTLANFIHGNLDYDTQALLSEYKQGQPNDELLAGITECLNNIINGEKISIDVTQSISLTPHTSQLINSVASGSMEVNRRVLEDALAPYLRIKSTDDSIKKSDATVLDAILLDDLRTEFISISQNLIMFGKLYDLSLIHISEPTRPY